MQSSINATFRSGTQTKGASKRWLPPSPPTSLQSRKPLEELVRNETSPQSFNESAYKSDPDLSPIRTSTAPVLSVSPTTPEQTITYLDLRELPEAVSYAWRTGRLPNWIRNFSNLQILVASEMGIVVVDQWLASLTKLEAIFLDRNQIWTWPTHLTKLKHLQLMSLDGNPCLEGMFNKSSTFRTAFFGCLASQPPRLSILPESLNGPEWIPAGTQNRSSIRSLCKGYFCGGIYTIPTPQAPPNDLFTPLGPCPLQDRLMNHYSPPRIGSDEEEAMLVEKPQIDVPYEVQRGFQLVQDLLVDIRVLLGEQELDILEYGPACLARTPIAVLSKDELLSHVNAFKLKEGLYVGHLGEIMRLFFNRRIKPWIATQLKQIFYGFPELYVLHSGVCLAFIKEIHYALENGVPLSDKFTEGIDKFCQQYAYCGAQFVASSRNLNNWTRDQAQGGSRNDYKFARWLEQQEHDGTHTLPTCQDYLAIPLSRLVEYNNFFSCLSKVLPEIGPSAEKIRCTWEQSIAQLQNTRRDLQQHTLANVYQCQNTAFTDYHWDVLLHVRTRTYLDRPKYEPVTADVIDTRNKSVCTKSVVKEIFNEGERQLRIIMCGRILQLWDHGLLSHITDISIEDFDATAEKSGGPDSVRILFKKVDETCVCDIIEYHSVENFAGDKTSSFLTAVQFQSVPICCSGEDHCDDKSEAGSTHPDQSPVAAELLAFDFSDDAESLLNVLMSLPDHAPSGKCAYH